MLITRYKIELSTSVGSSLIVSPDISEFRVVLIYKHAMRKELRIYFLTTNSQ